MTKQAQKKTKRPVCPNCDSRDVRTRRKRPRHYCRVCGHEWE